jgi:hypothetical protein
LADDPGNMNYKDIEAVYNDAYKQASDEFEQLDVWTRGRIYLGGIRGVEDWVRGRMAWILAERIVDGEQS